MVMGANNVWSGFNVNIVFHQYNKKTFFLEYLETSGYDWSMANVDFHRYS